LAILLASSGQLAAARDLWRTTFERNEATDQPGVNLALADCMLGNKDAAIKTLQRVLSFSPDHPVARKRLKAIQTGQEHCSSASE
jgi:hypothetical protein